MQDYAVKKQKMDERDLSLLSLQLQSTDTALSMIDAAKILSGLKLYSDDHGGVIEFLKAIEPKISQFSTKYNCQSLSSCIFGMQNMRSSCVEVRAILNALRTKLINCNEIFRPQGISMMIYGLKSMNSDSQEVLEMLAVISEKTRKCKYEFSGQAIGNSVYGLKGINDDNVPETRMLLTQLSMHFAQSRQELSPQEIANALYGMKSMKGCTLEALNMYRILAEKLKNCAQPLKSRELGMAVFPLKNWDLKQPVVRELLMELLTKMRQIDEKTWSPQSISNILYGLQNMDADSTEVLDMLEYVTPKISDSSTFGSQAVANSLYALKNMDGSHRIVRNLISELSKKVHTCPDTMTAREIGMSFYGLQRMSSEYSTEVLSLVSDLTRKLDNVHGSMNGQGFSNILYGVQNFGSEHFEIQNLLVVLTKKISESQCHFSEQEIGMSFFGFKNMKSNMEVMGLLDVLRVKLSHSNPVNARSLCMILYGLQNLDSDEQVVRRLIPTIVRKVKRCEDTFNAREIGNALYGLQNFKSDSKDVLQLLTALSDRIVECKEVLNDQEIGMALNGLKNMNENVIEVLNILSALDTTVSKTDGRKSFIVTNRCAKQ